MGVTIALIIIAGALSVFIIIVLVRLAKLIGEAEKTLVIINNRLPAELDNLHVLIEHAEKSLGELDYLMASLQEPIERIKAISSLGSGLVGAGGSALGFLGDLKSGLPKILAGVLSGLVTSLVARFINRSRQ